MRHFVKYAARNWLGLIPKGNSERREKKAARGPPALPGRVRRQPGSGEITRCMQPKSGFPSNFSILYHTILIMPIPWFHTASQPAAPKPRYDPGFEKNPASKAYLGLFHQAGACLPFKKGRWHGEAMPEGIPPEPSPERSIPSVSLRESAPLSQGEPFLPLCGKKGRPYRPPLRSRSDVCRRGGLRQGKKFASLSLPSKNNLTVIWNIPPENGR